MKTSEIIRRRRNHVQTIEHGNIAFRFFRNTVFVLMFLFCLAGIGICVIYTMITQRLPSLSKFQDYYEKTAPPTVIYDRTGIRTLTTLSLSGIEGKDLILCETDNPGCFPSMFITAVLAERDPSYQLEKNSGFLELFFSADDGIVQEMVTDVYGKILEENTNAFLLTRLLKAQVIQTFGKQQLLTWYLNNAWFGQNAFGLDAAAKTYLNKPADELNLAECILMSAILCAPALNPIDSEGAMRTFYISFVDNLVDKAVLSTDEANELKKTNFIIYEPPTFSKQIVYNPIIQEVLSKGFQIVGQKGIEHGGFEIISSEDFQLQKYLEYITIPVSDNNETDSTFSYIDQINDSEITDYIQHTSVSVSVIDVQTGQLIAAIETQIQKGKTVSVPDLSASQTGSLMSIFAMLAAFSQGYSPSSMVWDLETTGINIPVNYTNPDNSFHGPISLRTAVTNDFIRPIEAIVQEIGSAAILRQLKSFGLVNTGVNSFSMFSSIQATTEQIAFALTPFAAEGKQNGILSGSKLIPETILSLTDKEGNEIVVPQNASLQLIDQNLAYLTLHVLSEGEQSYKSINQPAGTKTGIVPNSVERWFAGFTSRFSICVRVSGEDEGKNSVAAELIWHSLMEYALADQNPSNWERPEGISQVMVCEPSGKLPTSLCPKTMSEVFLRGNEPIESDDFYISVPINTENQLIATKNTSTNQITEKIFMDIPASAKAWAQSARIELRPNAYDPVKETRDNNIKIIEPEIFRSFDSNEVKSFDVNADIQIEEKISSFQVSTGKGFYPETWSEQCFGQSIESGQWKLCSISTNALSPGLNCIHITLVTDQNIVYSADTYIVRTDPSE